MDHVQSPRIISEEDFKFVFICVVTLISCFTCVYYKDDIKKIVVSYSNDKSNEKIEPINIYYNPISDIPSSNIISKPYLDPENFPYMLLDIFHYAFHGEGHFILATTSFFLIFGIFNYYNHYNLYKNKRITYNVVDHFLSKSETLVETTLSKNLDSVNEKNVNFLLKSFSKNMSYHYHSTEINCSNNPFTLDFVDYKFFSNLHSNYWVLQLLSRELNKFNLKDSIIVNNKDSVIQYVSFTQAIFKVCNNNGKIYNLNLIVNDLRYEYEVYYKINKMNASFSAFDDIETKSMMSTKNVLKNINKVEPIKSNSLISLSTLHNNNLNFFKNKDTLTSKEVSHDNNQIDSSTYDV